MRGALVEAIDVWKSYDGSSFILRGVDLEVGPGEVRVIWGPNGSGKTTLLNILGCLDRPTRGRVAIDGVDVSACGEAVRARIRREVVGFVFQAPSLIDDLAVRENIALPLRLANRRDAAQRTREAMAAVGLQALERKKARELSGGEARLVAMARALANNPKVVLADEPTVSLDADGSQAVLGIISKLAEEGRAVVVASHDARVRRSLGVTARLKEGRLGAWTAADDPPVVGMERPRPQGPSGSGQNSED